MLKYFYRNVIKPNQKTYQNSFVGVDNENLTNVLVLQNLLSLHFQNIFIVVFFVHPVEVKSEAHFNTQSSEYQLRNKQALSAFQSVKKLTYLNNI